MNMLDSDAPRIIDKENLQLRGNQCLCRACGQYFKSVAGFEKHRTGSFRPMTRRCLTPAEMTEKGMILRGAYWITEAFNAYPVKG